MITITLRHTGIALHTCASWAEVFALDYPIAAVGIWRGFIWVRTRPDDDLAVARRHGVSA